MDVKITILQVDVANLRPNTRNTNSVGAQNFEKLKGSIEKLGFFKPILARELEDGFLKSSAANIAGVLLLSKEFQRFRCFLWAKLAMS